MSTHVRGQLPNKEVSILQTGQWWIAKLDEPSIAVQGESKEEALDKLEKRLEQYRERRSHDSEKDNHSNKRATRAQDVDQLTITR